MSWHHSRMAGFDTETSGLNLDTDRIVTACIVQVGGGVDPAAANWLTDAGGVDIPAEATAVHGVTTEQARANGTPAAEAVSDLIAALAQVALSGIPIVAMNAAFDLTVLDREARRYGLPTLTDVAGASLRVIDPLVIDRHVDTYRKGSRTLTALCAHYRVGLGKAHTADADAIAACRVAWRIAQRYEHIAAMSVDDLHEAQIGWHAAQAASLRAYYAATPSKRDRVVHDGWPVHPALEAASEGSKPHP